MKRHPTGVGDLAVLLHVARFADLRFTHCLEVTEAGERFPLFLATARTPAGERRGREHAVPVAAAAHH